jgi:hypothetical protein
LIGTGSGSIERCSSTATVIARHFAASGGIGGLAGGFAGTITNSSAWGDVTGGTWSMAVGGLVGSSTGPINHSHAMGTASAEISTWYLGGLVGATSAPIADSYAVGDLRVTTGHLQSIGGLVGQTTSSISRSFATGEVRTNWFQETVGGLVGEGGTSITDSYATGTLVGGTLYAAGGLIGIGGKATSISSSYATDKIKDGDNSGGFACDVSTASNDYWDTSTSGTTYGECGNTNIAGVNGLTTTQLQSGLPAGFDPKVWAQNRKINRGFPYLIANPPPQQ